MLENVSVGLRQYTKGWILGLLFALEILFVAVILPRTQASLEAFSGGFGPIDLLFF